MNKITELASEVQNYAHKAKILAQYMLEDEQTSSKCYTIAYFIDIMTDKIFKTSEEIELHSFKIKE